MISKQSDLQYQQIFHEYAYLAGAEKEEGSDSNYFLATQIQKHMGFEYVLKLIVSSTTDSWADIREKGFTCAEKMGYSDITSRFGLKKFLYLIVQPSGDFWVIRYGEPNQWNRCFGGSCGGPLHQSRKEARRCARWKLRTPRST